MPKPRRPRSAAGPPESVDALTRIPSHLAMHLADGWYAVTMAIGCTVRFGGDPMAWIIAAAIESPEALFRDRMAAPVQRLAPPVSPASPALERGTRIAARMHALWGEGGQTSWEWLLLARPESLSGRTPFHALRGGAIDDVEALLANMEAQLAR
jgi:hypothetical protein